MTKRKKQFHTPSQGVAPVHPEPNHALFRSWFGGLIALFFLILPWLNPRLVESPVSGQNLLVLMVAGLTVPFFLYGIWKGSLELPRTRLWWCYGLIILATISSALFATVPIRAIWGGYSYGADGLAAFLSVLYFMVVVWSFRFKPEHLVRILGLLALQQAVITLSVLFEVWQVAQITESGTLRVDSPFGVANYAISYYALTLPLVVTLVIQWFQERRRQKHAGWLWKLGTLHLFLSILAGFYLLPGDLQNILKSALGGSTTSVSTATQRTNQATQTESFLQNASNVERFQQWEIAQQAGQADPWTGDGPGSGRASFYRFSTDLKDWNYNVVSEIPHNETLQFYSQQGIPGVIAYVLAWFSILFLLVRSWLTNQQSYRWFAFGLTAGLLVYLAFNQLSFATPATATIAALLLGTIIGALEKSSTARFPFKTLTLVLCFTVFLISFWSWRYWVGSRHAFHSMNPNLPIPEAIKASDKAVTWMPYEPHFHRLNAGFHFARAVTEERILGKYQETDQLEAETHIEKAIALSQLDPRNYLSRAGFAFYFAQTEAEQETAFIAMLDAISRQPWNGSYYSFAKAIIAARVPGTENSYYQRLNSEFNIRFEKQL